MASKRGREALWEARLLIVFSAAFTMSDDLEAAADGEPEAEAEADAEAEAEGQSEAIGALATHAAAAAARVDACVHACCCIRQHTSAYVSIRQHTSAYVSVLLPRVAKGLEVTRMCVCV